MKQLGGWEMPRDAVFSAIYRTASLAAEICFSSCAATFMPTPPFTALAGSSRSLDCVSVTFSVKLLGGGLAERVTGWPVFSWVQELQWGEP